MAKITWVQPDGTAQTFEVPNGTPLMHAALDNNVKGIIGECGGGCACGTCKVYVDKAWAERVGGRTSLEQSIVGDIAVPGDHLRLSCQIVASDAFDGLVLHVPARQR